MFLAGCHACWRGACTLCSADTICGWLYDLCSVGVVCVGVVCVLYAVQTLYVAGCMICAVLTWCMSAKQCSK